MVTIQFVLDEGNVKKAGYTVAGIETYLRAFYAARHAAEREKYKNSTVIHSEKSECLYCI